MNNEGVDRTDPAELDQAGMDAQAAMAVLREAGERARRELAVRRPVVFATWGLALLLGYGVMWLVVRGQHPYTGPNRELLLLPFVLFALAVIVTGALVDRATDGVGGRAVLQRGVFILALFAGYVALGTEKLALSHQGASPPVLGLVGAAVPMFTAGLVLLASSAAEGKPDWARLVLGIWLLGVAAGGAWAGPVANLAICALVGGGGILLMAAVQPLAHRS